MSKRPDERRRKEALDSWKAEQRVTARAALPLPDAQMSALFDMLAVELPSKGCNHTLRLTRQWLVENGHPVASVEEWLIANGGCCDCEVLANSEQAWLDAIHDVNW
jgi:hypothetical protein